jgi:hypothetical protein
MDGRDKYLSRHMRQRRALAAALPRERQRRWAELCLAHAARQRRTAFYLMASLWWSAVAGPDT